MGLWVLKFLPCLRVVGAARSLAAALVAAVGLSACMGPPPPIPSTATTDTRAVAEYRLGPSDRLRVTVFRQEDLSGEFEVDGTGSVSLPLIGEVPVSGLTLRQFERQVEQKYKDDYLKDPKVNAEVVNYRPFFIYGEVNKPGQFPFESGMTVLKAVSTAGGFTFRANQRRVLIKRDGQNEEIEVPATSTVLVMPGDVIRVPERMF